MDEVFSKDRFTVCVVVFSLGHYLLGDLSSVKCQSQLLVAGDQPFLLVHTLPQLIIS